MSQVHPAPAEGRSAGFDSSITRSLTAVVVLCLCGVSSPRAAGLSLAEAEHLAIERDASCGNSSRNPSRCASVPSPRAS